MFSYLRVLGFNVPLRQQPPDQMSTSIIDFRKLLILAIQFFS